jgi:hypothetical protein
MIPGLAFWDGGTPLSATNVKEPEAFPPAPPHIAATSLRRSQGPPPVSERDEGADRSPGEKKSKGEGEHLPVPLQHQNRLHALKMALIPQAAGLTCSIGIAPYKLVAKIAGVRIRNLKKVS